MHRSESRSILDVGSRFPCAKDLIHIAVQSHSRNQGIRPCLICRNMYGGLGGADAHTTCSWENSDAAVVIGPGLVYAIIKC